MCISHYRVISLSHIACVQIPFLYHPISHDSCFYVFYIYIYIIDVVNPLKNHPQVITMRFKPSHKFDGLTRHRVQVLAVELLHNHGLLCSAAAARLKRKMWHPMLLRCSTLTKSKSTGTWRLYDPILEQLRCNTAEVGELLDESGQLLPSVEHGWEPSRLKFYGAQIMCEYVWYVSAAIRLSTRLGRSLFWAPFSPWTCCISCSWTSHITGAEGCRRIASSHSGPVGVVGRWLKKMMLWARHWEEVENKL